MAETFPQAPPPEAVKPIDTIDPNQAVDVGGTALTGMLDMSWLNDMDSGSEVFKPDFNTVFGFLDRQKDVLSDPDQRLSVVKGASAEQLMEQLDVVHAMMTPPEFHDRLDGPALVGSNIEQAHRSDGRREHVTSQFFVEPSDREEFMTHVHQRLQEAQSVSEAADIIAFSVLNMHTYADGNGRTARLLHTLIKDGYDGSPSDRERVESFASPRDNAEVRFMSFGIESGLKQALLNEVIGKETRTSSESDAQFRDAVTFEDTYNMDHVSGDILSNWISGVEDEAVKTRLVKVLQQSDFGEMAAKNVLAETENDLELPGGLGMYRRLQNINTVQAEKIIDLDRQVRLKYLKRVIDIASGQTVTEVNPNSGSEFVHDAKGLTMSSAYQKAYLGG